jgi:DNA-directed RNA polymerase specialized sigma24 family protein
MRRPRLARRAIESSRRAPLAGSSRSRIAEALSCCSLEERHVLALLLEERLTAAETAAALELSVTRVMRVRSTLFGELRRVLRGRPFRRAVTPSASGLPAVRRAA